MKIILDCDPGHDDAIALLLACASPELELLGVTTTYGNVDLARTTRNALAVLGLIGADVAVYPGAERPLLRPRLSAEAVHGASGLEGPALPRPTREPEKMHAARFIIEQVLASPGEVTLVPTGPLTNLALALRLEPRLAPAIKSIVLMGGAVGPGNWTPSAEFNILCDPHAARIVFAAAVPLTMFGLDLTHQTVATPARVARFRALNSRVGDFTADLLDFFRRHHEARYGWDGAPIHDPCTVAYLLRPELFTARECHVEVETREGPTCGRTVCDVWGVTGKAPNVTLPLEVDVEGLYDLLVERIARYGRKGYSLER